MGLRKRLKRGISRIRSRVKSFRSKQRSRSKVRVAKRISRIKTKRARFTRGLKRVISRGKTSKRTKPRTQSRRSKIPISTAVSSGLAARRLSKVGIIRKVGGLALRGGLAVAKRHPLIAAGVLGYGAYKVGKKLFSKDGTPIKRTSRHGLINKKSMKTIRRANTFKKQFIRNAKLLGLKVSSRGYTPKTTSRGVITKGELMDALRR